MKIKQSNGEAGGAWIIFITLTLSIVLTHPVVYFRVSAMTRTARAPGTPGPPSQLTRPAPELQTATQLKSRASSQAAQNIYRKIQPKQNLHLDDEEEERLRVAVHHVRAGVQAPRRALGFVGLHKLSGDVSITRNGLDVAERANGGNNQNHISLLLYLLLLALSSQHGKYLKKTSSAKYNND